MHGRWRSIGQENYCYQQITGNWPVVQSFSCLNGVDDCSTHTT